MRRIAKHIRYIVPLMVCRMGVPAVRSRSAVTLYGVKAAGLYAPIKNNSEMNAYARSIVPTDVRYELTVGSHLNKRGQTNNRPDHGLIRVPSDAD